MSRFGFMRSYSLATIAAILVMQAVTFGQTQVDFGQEGQPKPDQRAPAALIVAGGTKLLAGASGNAAALPTHLPFLQLVRVFRRNQNGFLLVRLEGTDTYGWVAESDVLRNEACLRVSAQNPVFQKVTLRNDWKAGAQAAAQIATRPTLPQEIEFLSAPGAAGSRVNATRISSVLHVFARREVDGVTYLLLGADPKWEAQRPGACIKGWVPERQCTRWNSRVAVYYNQTNQAQRPKVAIFRAKSDAQQFSRDGAVAGKAAIARESAQPHVLRVEENRFPVLEQEGDLLNVAFIASGRGIQVDRRLALDKNNVQVLFVIDGTSSMQPYFGAVQQAIRESRTTLSDGLTQLQFAVAVYRDYADGPKAAELIANFGDDRGLGRLGSLTASSNPKDTDLPEAVYNGIIRAIQSVNWNPRFTKCVIVIGDHGNHPVPDEVDVSVAGAAEPNGLTAKSVADVVDPRAGTLRYGQLIFAAINVNRRRQWAGYNNLFEGQMHKVLDLTAHGERDNSGRHGVGVVSRLDVDDPRDPVRAKEQVRRAILSAYRAAGNFAEELNRRVESGECGIALSGSDDLLGTQACAFLMDEVKKQGWMTPETGSTLISEEGWIPRQFKQQELVEPWVWMSRMEVYSFTGFLSGLLTAGVNAERAADIIAATVSTTTGDKFLDNETIADYVRRVFQVPFRSDLILRYTPEQLQRRLLEEAKFRDDYQKEIGRSLEQLSLAAAEQNPEVTLTWDSKNGRWLKPPTERIPTVPRWAASLGKEVFGWFPLRYLPGGMQ